MARSSRFLSVALLILTSLTVHCGAHTVAPHETASLSTAPGALLGTPDPALIRLMVRATVPSPPSR